MRLGNPLKVQMPHYRQGTAREDKTKSVELGRIVI